MVVALSLTAAIGVGAATGGASNREVGLFAFGGLAFHARQLRANQPAMHWPFVVGLALLAGRVLARFVFLDMRGRLVGVGRRGQRGGFHGFGDGSRWQVGFGIDRRRCHSRASVFENVAAERAHVL